MMISIRTKAAWRGMVLALALLLGATAQAQDAAVMTACQQELQKLFQQVFHDPTDNQRYNANEQAVALFHNALEQEKSFFWSWQLGKEVSVLTSKDKQFRIITWAVVRDNGEYECFGFVQSRNDKEERYDVYTLLDKSDEMVNVEESVLNPDNWLGAVYQDLVETKYDGHTYYTLLGWTGVNALTQRKVIEPILFRGSGSKPQFGQNLFRRDKNRRRVVMEYASNAMVNLRYDEQYVRSYYNKKVKGKKGRVMNVQQTRDDKMAMIIFDQTAPMIPGMEGLYQYYVPTGTEEAYVFEEGRWELQGYAFGEAADEKLNKAFKPLHKDPPAYQLRVPKDKD